MRRDTGLFLAYATVTAMLVPYFVRIEKPELSLFSYVAIGIFIACLLSVTYVYKLEKKSRETVVGSPVISDALKNLFYGLLYLTYASFINVLNTAFTASLISEHFIEEPTVSISAVYVAGGVRSLYLALKKVYGESLITRTQAVAITGFSCFLVLFFAFIKPLMGYMMYGPLVLYALRLWYIPYNTPLLVGVTASAVMLYYASLMMGYHLRHTGFVRYATLVLGVAFFMFFTYDFLEEVILLPEVPKKISEVIATCAGLTALVYLGKYIGTYHNMIALGESKVSAVFPGADSKEYLSRYIEMIVSDASNVVYVGCKVPKEFRDAKVIIVDKNEILPRIRSNGSIVVPPNPRYLSDMLRKFSVGNVTIVFDCVRDLINILGADELCKVIRKVTTTRPNARVIVLVERDEDYRILAECVGIEILVKM